jgi:hypothetical protein
MWVALMGYIPDNIIFWHIKDVVKGHSKLDHTQRRTQMTASFGYRFKDFPFEFICKLEKEERVRDISKII